MSKKGVTLYKVRKDVKCTKCENRGAIQHYGEYYRRGVGALADELESNESVRNKPHMSHGMGFGGTIPYSCLNCGNVGLIDFGGLEGYNQAFDTLVDGDYCVELAKIIMNRYPTTTELAYSVSFHTKALRFYVYEDDVIMIQSAKDTQAMIIEVKEPHENPVICINDEGGFVRCHKEKHYFLTHAKKLLGITESEED